jgi:hypothetical protein
MHHQQQQNAPTPYIEKKPIKPKQLKFAKYEWCIQNEGSYSNRIGLVELCKFSVKRTVELNLLGRILLFIHPTYQVVHKQFLSASCMQIFFSFLLEFKNRENTIINSTDILISNV